MKNKVHILFFFALFSCCKLDAQTNNIDFELTPAGTYTSANAVSGWTVSSQTNSSAPTSTIWTPGSPEFSIVSTPIPSFPIIGNIQHSPLGGTHVARLNNSTANYTSTKLSCDYFVTSTNSIFQFAYAGVLEGFPMSNQLTEPYYLVRIKDQFGAILSCSSLTISPNAGWQSQGITFSISLSSSTPTILSYWTNWQVKNIDLSLYINSNITIEVTSSDCIYGNHFGTLLFDANFPCTLPNINYCAGSTTASISAPLGHYPYSWYIGSLPIMFSTSPTVFLNNLPTPNANTTLTVHLNSNNPNCYYSLTYTLTPVPTNIYQIKSKPSCPGGTSGSATVIANAATSYTWRNSTNSVVSTSSVANNLAPGIYTVTVVGCGTVTDTVTIPTSSLTLNTVLKPYYGNASILSYPGGSNYQWYHNSTPISASLGGTASSYTVGAPVGQPTYIVSYDAPNGCRDSIKTILTLSAPGVLSLPVKVYGCPNSSNSSAIFTLSPAPAVFPGIISFSVYALGTTPAYTAFVNSASAGTFTASGLTTGGTYTVKASDGSCSYGSSFSVTPILFNFNITALSTTICSGSSAAAAVSFSQPASFSQYTYSWTPSTFLSGFNSPTTIISPTASIGTPTTITYSVVVTPTAGNCPLTKTISISALTLPTPSIVSIPTLCANASIYTITVNPSNGVFSNNIAINSFGHLDPSLANIGINTFTYAISVGSCSSIATSSFVVLGPTMTVNNNYTLLCGQAATLSASGADSYLWSNTLTSSSVVVSPVYTNTYTVIGTNTTNMCSKKHLITVVVTPTFVLVINSNTAACVGQPFYLGASGANTYTWSNGANGSVLTVTPNTSTTFSVKGTDLLGCQASATASVTVFPNTTTITVFGKFNTCAGATTTLYAIGANSYSINNQACYFIIPVTPTVNTTYTITGQDFIGCRDTETVTVEVLECVGLEDIKENEGLSIYPNPSTGKFFIEAGNISSISITDELGKIILDESLQKDNFQLDLSKYQNGIYFLKVVYNNQLKIIKLIKTE